MFTVRTLVPRINAILRSPRFFQVTLAFLIFESVWIVLSAVYPMAFDEDFHFGLIRLYSHYWLPFLNNQPPDAAAFGAVARDPSYLYHYLMSFPYRLIAHFVHGQTGQVIALRFINVALFSGGLVLFRRLLLRARLSLALANTMMLLFALIPITPQLAAHINYDNLLFPLVAWVCLLAFRVIDDVNHRQLAVKNILTLLAVCCFAGIVKYAFLPIFLGVVMYLLFIVWRQYRGQLRRLGPRLWQDWRNQSLAVKVLLPAVFILGCGMLLQRDGINLVRYHDIVPDCGQVLSVQTCSSYPAWYYTYNSHQVVAAAPTPGTLEHYNPVTYFGAWLYWMWYRLFFAINGPASGFVNYPPLPLPSAAALLLGITGLVMVGIWWRRLFRDNPYLVLFLVISLTYIAALLVDGYTAYKYTNVLQTMNGRYLVPILLLLAAIMGKAFSLELRQNPRRKTILAALALFLFLQGGGFLTFITRSDASWNWPNPAVVKANNAVRTLTKPVIIKGSKSYSTSFWVFN